jgi:hypothetical protein
MFRVDVPFANARHRSSGESVTELSRRFARGAGT